MILFKLVSLDWRYVIR